MASIYQSGGYWVVKITVLGKSRVFKARTREEAVAKAHRFLEQRQHPAPEPQPTPPERTLAQWVREYLELGTWRPSTKATYARCLEAWLSAPGLADTPLSALSPLALRQVLASWHDTVSPALLSQRYRALRACLEEAWRLELIPENPLKRVPAPRVPRQVRSIWSPEQASRYLEACLAALQRELPVPYAEHADALALALLTGLRISEVLGLHREDVTERGLVIRHALTWVDGKPHLMPTKTPSSHRILPLSPLATQLVQQRLQRKSTQALLFTARNGSPLRRDNLLRLHQALCDAAEVPRCRIHDLRRVHASLLLQAGTPITTVQRLLGHSTSRLTLEVYSYVTSLDVQDVFGTLLDK
jgi:integrase